MRVRLKGPGGAATLTLADDATVGDLLDQIAEKTSVSKFDIKYGYPPKPLPLEDSERSKQLVDLDVKLNGESLTINPQTVEQAANRDVTPSKQSSQSASLGMASQRGKESAASVSFRGMDSPEPKQKPTKPVSLQKKATQGEVPELPLPERGATLGKFSEFLLLGQRLTHDSPASYAR